MFHFSRHVAESFIVVRLVDILFCMLIKFPKTEVPPNTQY